MLARRPARHGRRLTLRTSTSRSIWHRFVMMFGSRVFARGWTIFPRSRVERMTSRVTCSPSFGARRVTAEILDGRKMSAQVLESVKRRVDGLQENGIHPTLCFVTIGESE